MPIPPQRPTDGRSGRFPEPSDGLAGLRDDLPVSIIIVDSEDRIRDFLAGLHDVVDKALVVLDRVEIYVRPPAELRSVCADQRIGA